MNMILTVYAVLGFYTFLASFNPAAHKSLLSFGAWGGQLAHAVIATFAIFSDDTPVYSGPSMFGEIPETVFGLTHWSNIFVDVPLLYVMFAINLYFFKACFGSYLLPWQV